MPVVKRYPTDQDDMLGSWSNYSLVTIIWAMAIALGLSILGNFVLYLRYNDINRQIQHLEAK